MSALGTRIEAASPDEVKAAVPWMIAAAATGDDGKRNCAAVGLMGVGLRTDSPALLKDHIGEVAALLNSSDSFTQGFSVTVLGSVQQRQPTAVPGLLNALLSFVKRTDRYTAAQVSAIAFLLKEFEGDQAVLDAVESFCSREIDSDSRTRIVFALGLGEAQRKPARVVDLIAANLSDPSLGVRAAAVDVLSRMGPQAVIRAEPQLRKLIQQADQPEVVKSAARKVLRDAGLSAN